jgi:hypothetical protein
MKLTPEQIERFWNGVEKLSDCWVWKSSKAKNSYGRITIDKKRVLTHRVALFLAGVKLSKTDCVLHKCDNPPCCNPEHLFVGSRVDNNRDAKIKGRTASSKNGKSFESKVTHCPNGHLYSSENIYLEKKKYGLGRKCRACVLSRANSYFYKNKAARIKKAAEYYAKNKAKICADLRAKRKLAR